MRSLLSALLLLLIVPLANATVTRSLPPPQAAASRGVQAWPSGALYVGEFRNGRRDGRGTYTWPNGDRYEGEWRAGRPYGQGVAESRGVRVRGSWVDGCLRKGPYFFALGRPASECPAAARSRLRN